ncbi:MAG: phenylalanine--tRNA ligase beta subunit-related protein [Bacteroidaceae bacterium]
MKFKIQLAEEIKRACPTYRGAALSATVVNTTYNAALWEMIASFTLAYQKKYTTESLKQMQAIQATRLAYKACGKDPSRYRPAAEALCRRLIKGASLYQINTLVDLINVVSIQTGFSIGGFDADKIQGTTLTLGIGRKAEPYEGIGRGALNIAGLPVFRDQEGGFGTPTSDHERTKIELSTTHLLVTINGYGGEIGLKEAVELLQSLLERYGQGVDIEVCYF